MTFIKEGFILDLLLVLASKELIQVWEEIPPRTISADSTVARQDVIGSAYRHKGSHYIHIMNCRDDIHTHSISLWFQSFTLIFGVILNRALSGLMSLVSIDFFFFFTPFCSQQIIQCTSEWSLHFYERYILWKYQYCCNEVLLSRRQNIEYHNIT